jgi:TniQ
METMLESWDLTIPDVSPHARFYPLDPIGIGTPWVESLSSYLLRLAQAHCVPVKALTDELRRSAATAPPSPEMKICGRPYRLLSYSVNGVEESAVKWVYALGAATLRDDLKNLTLLAFKDFLCSLSLFRRVRTWGPVCFGLLGRVAGLESKHL